MIKVYRMRFTHPKDGSEVQLEGETLASVERQAIAFAARFTDVKREDLQRLRACCLEDGVYMWVLAYKSWAQFTNHVKNIDCKKEAA